MPRFVAARAAQEFLDAFRVDWDPRKDLIYTIRFLLALAAFGFAATLLWSTTQESPWHVFGIALMLIGAAGVLGGLMGFLFGIPRTEDARRGQETTVRSQTAAAADQADDVAAGGTVVTSRFVPAASSTLGVNTNLEQISDWLTKILVGVGLTQLSQIPTLLGNTATYFADAFGSSIEQRGLTQISAVLILYGFVSGFLGGYLLTRMFLPGAFDRAQELLARRISDLESGVRERESLIQRSSAELDQVRATLAETEERAREAETLAGERAAEIEKRNAVRATEAEIYDALYDTAKRGFERAIEKGERLVRELGPQTRATLWAYLAAAYGQAYVAALGRSDLDEPSRTDLANGYRRRALDAVRNALAKDGSWKPVLATMWNPQIPNKGGEDDLECFYGDEDFRKLLG